MSQDLIEQLQNHSYEKRIEVIEELREKANPTAIPALLHAASDQEESLWRGTDKGKLLHPDAAEHPRYYAHKAAEELSQSAEGFIVLRDSLTHRDSLIRAQRRLGDWVIIRENTPKMKTTFEESRCEILYETQK